MREKILNKIHELEWNNKPRSLELIEFLKDLLKELPEEKPEVIEKKVEIELPEVKEEAKPAPKRKIVFKRK